MDGIILLDGWNTKVKTNAYIVALEQRRCTQMQVEGWKEDH